MKELPNRNSSRLPKARVSERFPELFLQRGVGKVGPRLLAFISLIKCRTLVFFYVVKFSSYSAYVDKEIRIVCFVIN